jgi:predicted Fe-Mo cluster-binding NifX family protein
MKKIAIPTREGMVDDHFGHCAYITVIRGCHGKVDDVLRSYQNGELQDSLESCDHHDCNHHEEKPVYVIPSFKK